MDLFDLVAKITLDKSELDAGLKSAQSEVEAKATGIGKRMGTAMWGFWSEVGRKAATGVFNLIGSNVDGAVKRFDTLNNFPKVMQSLGFSAQDAKAGIDSLADGIAHLPTTLDAVAAQAQQFVPMTGNIQKATDVTLALNNAMAAGGKDAETQKNAIEQWTKSMARGKPEFEAWNAMVQTAPAQMDQLAKSMLGANANQNDLYEAMKNGSVTIDEVNDKMIDLTKNGGEGFASWEEQAKNASAGIQMSLVNVKAAAQRNIANVMSSLDGALEKFGGVAGIIQSAVEPINKVGETIQKAFEQGNIEDGINYLLEQIGQFGQQFIPKGMELVSNLLTGIGEAAPSLIQGAASMIGNLLIGIAQGIPDLIVGGLNLITGLLQGISQGQPELVNKIIEVVKVLAKGLIDNAPAIASAGLQLMSALATAMMTIMLQIPSRLAGVARKIPSAIKSGVGSLAGIGRNMIEGLWGGIKAKFDSVVAKVKALAASLPKAVKKVLGIASPSKVFKNEIGKMIPLGLAEGIEDNIGTVEDAMDSLSSVTTAPDFGAIGADYSVSSSITGQATESARGFDYNTFVSAIKSALSDLTAEAVFNVDGQEMARVTAPFVSAEIDKIQVRADRKLGYI